MRDDTMKMLVVDWLGVVWGGDPCEDGDVHEMGLFTGTSSCDCADTLKSLDGSELFTGCIESYEFSDSVRSSAGVRFVSILSSPCVMRRS